MTVEPTSKPHQLHRTNRDWLLTLLTAVLALMIFVFAPLRRDVYGHHTQNTYESLLLRLPGQGNRWPRSPRHRGS